MNRFKNKEEIEYRPDKEFVKYIKLIGLSYVLIFLSILMLAILFSLAFGLLIPFAISYLVLGIKYLRFDHLENDNDDLIKYQKYSNVLFLVFLGVLMFFPLILFSL